MEILRYSKDAWGQTVLEGMSWDLFWYFVGAGVASGIYLYRIISGSGSNEIKGMTSLK